MFTGIIEETGNVLAFREEAESWRLEIGAAKALHDLELGDSIAVNGCCLTAVASDAEKVCFDLLAESRRLTTFQDIDAGALVNLERAARFNGKMGGHFVTGHIDGIGIIEVLAAREDWISPLWLVTHVDLHRTAKVQAFVKHLKAYAEGMETA